jgi:hypothetical protein
MPALARKDVGRAGGDRMEPSEQDDLVDKPGQSGCEEDERQIRRQHEAVTPVNEIRVDS